MSNFYANMAATALRLITSRGRSVSLVYHTTTPYDPSTDVAGVQTATTANIKGVFTDYNARDIDDTIIKRGDKELMIAASGIVKPQTNDKIIDNGDTYNIRNIKEIAPGDTALIYKIQVRK